MKKKFREITVDNLVFGWTINENCDGDGGKCVKIWKNKKIIYETILNNEYITPALIRDIIKKYVI